jgi:Leucine-rich repeat (LRR) protein
MFRSTTPNTTRNAAAAAALATKLPAAGSYPFEALVVLNLAHNGLQETPPQLNVMKQLRYLDLSNNSISTLTTRSQEGTRPASTSQSIGLAQLVSLNLSNNHLTSFPPTWCLALSRLRHLMLQGNRFRHLPTELNAMASTLLTLDVRNNRLQDLPDALGELTQLRELLAGNNQIKAISTKCLSTLIHLRRLELQRNQLTCLPQGRVGGERGCLEVLLIYNNKLSHLPNDLDARYKRLVTFNASHNALVELPPSLSELPNIETLQLHHNLLTALPPSFGAESASGGLARLCTLGLQHNEIGELPQGFGLGLPSLTCLDVSDNLLQDLPNSLSVLHKLGAQFYAGGNRFSGELRNVIEYGEYQSTEERKLVLCLRKIRDELFPDTLRSVCARLRMSKDPILVQGERWFEHMMQRQDRLQEREGTASRGKLGF